MNLYCGGKDVSILQTTSYTVNTNPTILVANEFPLQSKKWGIGDHVVQICGGIWWIDGLAARRELNDAMDVFALIPKKCDKAADLLYGLFACIFSKGKGKATPDDWYTVRYAIIPWVRKHYEWVDE